jgi:plastocyanin
MKRLVYVSIGLLIAIVIVSTVAISGSKKKKGNIDKTKPTPTTTQEITRTQGETVDVQVLAGEYYFSPSILKINKGDTLKITLKNVGKMPHNLVFEEQNIATKTIQRGESDTIEFTATQSGQSKFYCSIGNYRALGMEGDLEVR